MEAIKETIVCPECGHEQEAEVKAGMPFFTYIHDCENCGHTITESEWLTAGKNIDPWSIYAAALKKWGLDNQVDMLQEECIELALAIRKFRRNPSPETFENFCEEAADVIIMSEQMTISREDISCTISKWKEKKLIRLAKRITDEAN